MAEWLCGRLQIFKYRFDSGFGLQFNIMNKNLKFVLKNCIYKYIISWTLISVTAIYWSINSKLTPKFIGNLIDSLVKKSDDTTTLVFYFLFIRVLYMILTRLYDYIWLRLRIELKKTIMEEIFYFTLQNKIKDFNTIFNLLKNIVDELPYFLNLIFNNFAAYIAVFIFASREFYMLDAYILYSFIALVTTFTFGILIVIKKGFVVSNAAIEKQNNLMNYMFNIRDNFFYIQFYKNFYVEKQKFKSNSDDYYRSLYSRDYLYFILHFSQTFISFSYEFFCLYILINKFYMGQIQVGELTAFFMFNKFIIQIIWEVSSDVTKIIKYYQSIYTSLNSILSQEEQILLSSDTVKKYDIEFKNVEFEYFLNKDENDKTVNVIKDFNLSISENEKIIILGESGKGKSTIINLLINKYLCTNGNITIGNVDIVNLDLSNYISIINQDLSLFNRNFYENIGYGNLNATHEEIEEIAKSVNIHNVIMEKGGYEIIVDDKSNNLSYGQKQRILIARALISKTPILIMDEPTSALDDMNEDIVNKILTNTKNKTIILISHKKDILKTNTFRTVNI